MAEKGGNLSLAEGNILQISGAFDYRSIVQLRAQGEDKIQLLSGGTCCVDLSRVEDADSVFMALLLSWLRFCSARGVTLRLVGVPDSLLAMARVSGLDSILPFASNPDPEKTVPGL